MTFTRRTFQSGWRPAAVPRPMAAASRAGGAEAIRCCTAGAAAIGAASGAKLLNAPHISRVNRKGQTSSRS